MSAPDIVPEPEFLGVFRAVHQGTRYLVKFNVVPKQPFLVVKFKLFDHPRPILLVVEHRNRGSDQTPRLYEAVKNYSSFVFCDSSLRSAQSFFGVIRSSTLSGTVVELEVVPIRSKDLLKSLIRGERTIISGETDRKPIALRIPVSLAESITNAWLCSLNVSLAFFEGFQAGNASKYSSVRHVMRLSPEHAATILGYEWLKLVYDKRTCDFRVASGTLLGIETIRFPTTGSPAPYLVDRIAKIILPAQSIRGEWVYGHFMAANVSLKEYKPLFAGLDEKILKEFGSLDFKQRLLKIVNKGILNPECEYFSYRSEHTIMRNLNRAAEFLAIEGSDEYLESFTGRTAITGICQYRTRGGVKIWDRTGRFHIYCVDEAMRLSYEPFEFGEKIVKTFPAPLKRSGSVIVFSCSNARSELNSPWIIERKSPQRVTIDNGRVVHNFSLGLRNSDRGISRELTFFSTDKDYALVYFNTSEGMGIELSDDLRSIVRILGLSPADPGMKEIEEAESGDHLSAFVATIVSWDKAKGVLTVLSKDFYVDIVSVPGNEIERVSLLGLRCLFQDLKISKKYFRVELSYIKSLSLVLPFSLDPSASPPEDASIVGVLPAPRLDDTPQRFIYELFQIPVPGGAQTFLLETRIRCRYIDVVQKKGQEPKIKLVGLFDDSTGILYFRIRNDIDLMCRCLGITREQLLAAVAGVDRSRIWLGADSAHGTQSLQQANLVAQVQCSFSEFRRVVIKTRPLSRKSLTFFKVWKAQNDGVLKYWYKKVDVISIL